jgi:hypothetical protein
MLLPRYEIANSTLDDFAATIDRAFAAELGVPRSTQGWTQTCVSRSERQQPE